MVDEGLVRYVRERLGEGYQEAEIRAALAQHGHPQQAIDEAFQHIHREGKHNLLIPALLFILILIALLLFLALRATPASPPVQNSTPQQNQSGPPSSSVLQQAAELKAESVNQTPDETYYATVQEAKSGRSVSDAILLCSINKETNYKNYCLQEIAEAWREPRLCEVIGDISQRDDCYLGLIFDGEDQYCSRLQLEENKRVCDLLLGNA